MASRIDPLTGLTQAQARHKGIFVPKQCNLRGCSADGTAALLRCAQCTLVMYCSKEHQKADWKHHKVECKHLSELGVVGFPFSVSDECKDYPLTEFLPWDSEEFVRQALRYLWKG